MRSPVRRHLLVPGVLAALAGAVESAPAAPTVTAQGVLQRAIADDFSHGRAREHFSVRTATGPRRLRDQQPEQLVGQRVQVTGETTAAGIGGTVTTPVAPTAKALATTGPRTMAVVMVSFPENRVQPFTATQVRDAVFDNTTDSLNAFFREQTGGATWFTGIRTPGGDVFGPWTSPVAGTSCDIDAIDVAGHATALAAGVDLDAYDHVVYVTPRATCPGGTPEGVAYMPGRISWMNANIATWVIAHEIGHNFGSSHAGAVRCVDAAGHAVPLGTSCFAGEYNDPHSVMGNSTTVRLTDTWHRHQNGELAPDQVRVAATPGTYGLLNANNFVATGAKLVLVPRVSATGTANGYFAIEARRPAARYDTFPANSAVATGVMIRVVSDVRSRDNSYLVDASPATTSLNDAALQPGQTFTDPGTGLQIANVSPSADAPAVSVTVPGVRDTSAPTTPGTPTVTSESSGLRVTWSAATDNDRIDRYEVFRDERLILTTTLLQATDVLPDGVTGAAYRVAAVDPSGNRASSPTVWFARPPAPTPTVLTPTAVSPTTVPATSTPPFAPGTGVPALRSGRPGPHIRLVVPRMVGARARLGAARRIRIVAPGATRIRLMMGSRLVDATDLAVLDTRLPRSVTLRPAGVTLTIRATGEGRASTARLRLTPDGRIVLSRP